MTTPVAAAHEDDEHEIHLPSPSLSPVVIAIGVTLACFGLLTTPILIAVGGAVLLFGLATWLIDDARGFAAGSDLADGEHGGGH